MMKKGTTPLALCIDNDGHEASLIPGKVYRVIADARAAREQLLRIVDESGEDYLCDARQFALVDFPQPIRTKLLKLQRAG